jgi:hypothetical protein
MWDGLATVVGLYEKSMTRIGHTRILLQLTRRNNPLQIKFPLGASISTSHLSIVSNALRHAEVSLYGPFFCHTGSSYLS